MHVRSRDRGKAGGRAPTHFNGAVYGSHCSQSCLDVIEFNDNVVAIVFDEPPAMFFNRRFERPPAVKYQG